MFAVSATTNVVNGRVCSGGSNAAIQLAAAKSFEKIKLKVIYDFLCLLLPIIIAFALLLLL